MISTLSKDSLPQIEEIGKAFADEAKYPSGFNLSAFLDVWNPVMDAGFGEILVYKEGERIVGALGMMVLPDMFSGVSVASELFWYVLPSHRATRAGVELFYRFENLGKLRGARKFIMAHLALLTPKKLQDFYEKNGYELVEQTFLKELR